MRHPNLKYIALAAALATLVAVLGCGGGSDSTSVPHPAAAAPAGGTTTQATSPAREKGETKPEKQKRAAKAKTGKDGAGKKKTAEEKAKDLVKKYANSGKPVDADSPVAKKILQAIGQGRGGKEGGHHKTNAVEKALEQVTSPNGGKQGDGSGGQGGGDNAVAELLETLQHE